MSVQIRKSLSKTWLVSRTAALSLALCMALGPSVQAGGAEQISASLVLKVKVPEDAAEALVKKAEELNGYFTQRTTTQVVLKVPSAQAKPFLEYAKTLGVVADRSYQTADIGQQLAEKQARLSARQDMMRQYLQVMQGAQTQGVLQVEEATTRLVAEIENLKGSIRLMQHRMEYAEVAIDFQFRDRAAPVKDGRSSFAWLNTMNLSDLVEDFQNGNRN